MRLSHWLQSSGDLERLAINLEGEPARVSWAVQLYYNFSAPPIGAFCVFKTVAVAIENGLAITSRTAFTPSPLIEITPTTASD